MSKKPAALKAMLAVLDGWIEGAQSNHEALGHRETGCCSTFAPEDIRRMVEDAAEDAARKKKREKKGAALPSAAPRRTLIVELKELATGVYSTHALVEGDTIQVNVNGYITVDGASRKVIEFPVQIRVRS